MKKAFVIGGGISGILSAFLLRKRNFDVSLIENQNVIGGLLNSYETFDLKFDFGTHFLTQTEIEEIDFFLFDDLINNQDWQTFHYLKAGNFFKGKLNDKNATIDIRYLEEVNYLKAVVELFNTNKYDSEAENLEIQISSFYGETITNEVFRPLIYKFFKKELNEMTPNSFLYFASPYLTAFNESSTEELKKSNYFNNKFAYNSFERITTKRNNFYPKNQGIGIWIDQLTDKLKNLGVEILINSKVDSLEIFQKNIHKIEINNQKFIVDVLVWAAPVFGFLNALQTKFDVFKPQLKKTVLCNYIFEKPFLTDLFYVHNLDLNHFNFRTTIYSNVTNQKPFSCTVEVLVDEFGNEDELLNEIIPKELTEMSIIDDKNLVLFKEFKLLPGGFPIPTLEFSNHSKKQLEFAEALTTNTVFLGRTGTTFFMKDVLIETYKKVIEYAD